nr:succinate dehydrogenase flavoprotein subunit [Pantoea septica]
MVAQARAFVNAFKRGTRAHVPAMPFHLWEQFMTSVSAELDT